MVIEYWKTRDERSCCGCRACEQVCSTKALSMEPNEEGFLYPALKIDLCKECGKCSAVCPVENRPGGSEPIEAYAVQHKDEKILKKSSSGGVFRMLADEVLGQGGCVVGCRWGKENRPFLALADDVDAVSSMQGSKYLFSDTNTIYAQVKERLCSGQGVLFSGAPCQCAALQNYLGREYENLVVAEFLCHGMPSQQIFDAYVHAIEQKLQTPIYDIRFRDKEKRGWGYAFSYKYMMGGREKYRSNVGLLDCYMYGFIQGYYNRYSCYACSFRGKYRVADITFCDYWGVERESAFSDAFFVEKGVSAVTANSPKGKDLIERVKTRGLWLQTEAEAVARENAMLLAVAEKQPPEIRTNVYRLVRELGWNETARRYFCVDRRIMRKIWYLLPLRSSKKIRRFMRRG